MSMCATNQVCDATTNPASPTCVCDLGFRATRDGCVAYVCPAACGDNAYCTRDLVCDCRPGFEGDPNDGCTVPAPVTSCAPYNPCLNGGTCAVAGDSYTCTCVNGATGSNCETLPVGSSSCGTYTDIVYAVTVTFDIRETPLMIGDQTFAGLTTNAATTPFVAGSNNTTPLVGGGALSKAFLRLRFENDAAGEPIAGTVQLVEWFAPLEFTQTKGATVVADTDHTVGLIDSTLSACGAGGTTCMNYAPALTRTCTAHGRGRIIGQTLRWDTCTPPPSGLKTWDYAKARESMGPGCVSDYTTYGNTTSTSTAVPPAGKGDAYQSWTQLFSYIAFSGTDLASATITMPPMQLPNPSGISTTWMSITSSQIVTSECASTPQTFTCDEDGSL